MRDTIISEDVAKLARKKNVIIPSRTFYCDNHDELCYIVEESLILVDSGKVIYDCNMEFNTGTRYDAPIQPSLQTELRNKHSIFVNVQCVTDCRFDINEDIIVHYFYDIMYFVTNKTNKRKVRRINKDLDGFSTWESALDKGLLEGLKLIK